MLARLTEIIPSFSKYNLFITNCQFIHYDKVSFFLIQPFIIVFDSLLYQKQYVMSAQNLEACNWNPIQMIQNY